MRVDLSLINVAAFRFKYVFDWVLQSENVILTVHVDEVDQGRHRGGLTRTNRSGDQNETILVTREGPEAFDRKLQIFHGPDIGSNDPENDLIAQALFNNRSAETSKFTGIGKVNIT